jgi:heme/flavin dehydrogenase (mycofactocin system)
MASPGNTFETVAEAQRRAHKRLPRSLYVAVLGGQEQGITRDDNEAAFGELRFVPRISTGLSGPRELATTVLGVQVSMPVIMSPTGAQGIHPEGEVAVARAAAAAGTAVGLSSFATKPIEEVAAANPQTFFQMFWLGSRDDMAGVMDRARSAGAKALIVTLDYVFPRRRDWGTPMTIALYDRIGLRTLAKHYGRDAIRAPRWLLDWLRAGGVPPFTAPNLAAAGQPTPLYFPKVVEWMQTPAPTWPDIAWMREEWGGPFVVKGVAQVDDARQAVETGATAISVSNYGGFNLDGTPASIRLLPAIADAVGDQIEVLIDGGIRRGADVVKAVALGARAVMIGRAYLWGLAANGEAGVANVLQILRAGIDETLNGLGRASIHDVVAEDVVVPPGFAVTR